MVGLNASVNDIGTGSGTSAIIVTVCGRAGARVRETGKAPGGIALGDGGGDMSHGILLDVLDLCDCQSNRLPLRAWCCFATHVGIITELLDLLLSQARRESADVVIHEVGLGRDRCNSLVNHLRGDAVLGGLLHLDNVLALDELDIARDVERRSLVRRGSHKGQKGEESFDTHFDDDDDLDLRIKRVAEDGLRLKIRGRLEGHLSFVL